MAHLTRRLRRAGPAPALAGLVVFQWLVVALFASQTRHNGWLFYHGGDSTWYYTTSWVLAHGHVPFTAIGYLWSLALAPVAAIAGPSIVAGLPGVVLLQCAVLLPLGILAIYAIAAGLGGRAFGLWAASAWVALPFVAIPLFNDSYRETYVELFVPQALGLTFLGDLPSTVCLLGASVLVFRALDLRSLPDAALAGILTGIALGLKPSNAIFLAAPVVAFALARQWRALPVFGLALVPALAALSLWKLRGLGDLPILTAPVERLAGSEVVRPADRAGGISYYFRSDRAVLGENFRDLRDFFWSLELLQWAALAGVFAVARRSLAKAAFLGVWLVMFVIFKGAVPEASVDSGSFFRLMMPSFPAFALLALSTPLIVPGLGGHLVAAARPPRRPLRWKRPAVLVPVALVTLVPLVLFGALRPLRSADAARLADERLYLPVASDFEVRARRQAGGFRLDWRAPPTGASEVFYRVYRAREDGDVVCSPVAGATSDCRLTAGLLGTTRATSFADDPPPGRWSYRVGLAANWRDDVRLGDTLLLSRPVVVDSPR